MARLTHGVVQFARTSRAQETAIRNDVHGLGKETTGKPYPGVIVLLLATDLVLQVERSVRYVSLSLYTWIITFERNDL